MIAELEHAFKFNDAVLRHPDRPEEEGRDRSFLHDEDRRGAGSIVVLDARTGEVLAWRINLLQPEQSWPG